MYKRQVWESPAVGSDQKRALLDALASQAGMLRPIRNFFAVLIDHGRIPMLAQIARQFEAELNNQLGFVEAGISSSRQLSAEEKQELVSQVERITRKKVRARYDTNPDLLGGAVVRVGHEAFRELRLVLSERGHLTGAGRRKSTGPGRKRALTC